MSTRAISKKLNKKIAYKIKLYNTLPPEIIHLINKEMDKNPDRYGYTLLSWIKITKLDIDELCSNPRINEKVYNYLKKQQLSFENYIELSSNPGNFAMILLIQYINNTAIQEQEYESIIKELCSNTSEHMYKILKKDENFKYINWNILCNNSSNSAAKLILMNKDEDKVIIPSLGNNNNKKVFHLIKIGLNNKKIKLIHIAKNTNPDVVKLIEEEITNLKNDDDFLDAFNFNKSKEALKILIDNRELIKWKGFSNNPHSSAIKILKENIDDIDWEYLIGNKNKKAMKIIQEYIDSNLDNLDNLDWDELSKNPNTIMIIKSNPIILSKIDWYFFNKHTSSEGIDFLKENKKRFFDPEAISSNENIFYNPKNVLYGKVKAKSFPLTNKDKKTTISSSQKSSPKSKMSISSSSIRKPSRHRSAPI